MFFRNVCKYYSNYSLIAVNGLYLCIPQGECFGLMGRNGAGKTSTVKMLTGEEPISYGDAFVEGYHLTSQLNQVYNNYLCVPQGECFELMG